MNENLKALFVHQYKMLNELFNNINKNTFTAKPENGKWSVFENIAHLGRYNEVFLGRMEEIQHKNNPAFESYVADNEEGFIEWRGKSFDLALADFYSSRETIIKFFESLSDEQLKRVGTHAKFGELTTNEWLHFFLLHEAHHLFTIFKMLHKKEE
jgi:uncharacterized damage-inducible protein DinB